MDILEVFSGKRVLVTGDTGFKGSWLSMWLHMLGAEVVGYALPPETAEDHFNKLQLAEYIHHVDGDIRDYEAFAKVFAGFKPEIMFHLAAQPLVRLSYEEPKLTFDTNVAGSVNILEMVRLSNSLRSFIYVTSDKCYKNKEWLWGYRESDELGGRDPYSASKSAAEIVFASYLESFLRAKPDFGAASVRAGNVIGGGDWAADRIVPDCIKALKAGEPIVLRNPVATRPWQHVLEPLHGYLVLAAKLYSREDLSGSWNFGPLLDSIRTVKDLAELVVKFWGEGEIVAKHNPNAPHEAKLLHLNCDKARYLLGWKPKWGFVETISKTVEWYRASSEGGSVSELTTKQIKQYMETNDD